MRDSKYGLKFHHRHHHFLFFGFLCFNIRGSLKVEYCYRLCTLWCIHIYFLDDGGNFKNYLMFQCLFCNLSNYKLNLSSYMSSLLPLSSFNQGICIITGKIHGLIFHLKNLPIDLFYPLYTFYGLTSRNIGENLLRRMKCPLCYHIVYRGNRLSFLIPYVVQ